MEHPSLEAHLPCPHHQNAGHKTARMTQDRQCVASRRLAGSIQCGSQRDVHPYGRNTMNGSDSISVDVNLSALRRMRC